MEQYERPSKRSFNRADRVRARSLVRAWIGAGLLAGVCLVGSVACGVHRELIYTVEVDTAIDTVHNACTVEVWRQYFPRKVTKFRVKPLH